MRYLMKARMKTGQLRLAKPTSVGTLARESIAGDKLPRRATGIWSTRAFAIRPWTKSGVLGGIFRVVIGKEMHIRAAIAHMKKGTEASAMATVIRHNAKSHARKATSQQSQGARCANE